MKTLASIAVGYDDSLISRAAGVMLKEGRKLILCPRETPLSAVHLENMLKLSRLGVRIVPPMPAFYNAPETIDDLIAAHITKVLDQLGLPNEKAKRWGQQ
jgi:4-hydroxy-3-polyprenylbenzoate decarboxylase